MKPATEWAVFQMSGQGLVSNPAYKGMKWMPCSCRLCGPTDASGRQQCDVTVGGCFAKLFGAFCDDCREQHDNDKVD